jgi:superfamily II DNA or RNA helicase
VPDASLAIIVAGTRVKRQMIQRIGRVLRRSSDKKIARVFKVFVRGGLDDPTGQSAGALSRASYGRAGRRWRIGRRMVGASLTLLLRCNETIDDRRLIAARAIRGRSSKSRLKRIASRS